MRLTRARENVFELTATTQELSALMAAARMARDALEHEPAAPREAVELLTRILREYDAALERLEDTDGRPERPSDGSP